MSVAPLIDACEALVTAKIARAPHMSPSTWLRLVLPFADPAYDYASMPVETISPFQVVSGNVRERRFDTPATAAKIMAESNRLALAGDPHASPETPRYAKIGKLPLYCALEGKNRVACFRTAKRPMVVFVTPTHFPAPHDLLLERVWPGNFFALRNGNRSFLIPEPEAVSVLLAYGVEFGRRRFVWKASRTMKAIRSRLASSEMRP